MEPIVLSPSKVGTFVNCGRQYRFQYFDKIPGEQSEAMVRGTVVHRALERFYGEAERTPESLDYYVQCGLHETEAEWTPVVDDPSAFSIDVRTLAHRIFQAENPREVEVL